MLLLIALTLKGSIAISPTPPPSPIFGGGISGGAKHSYVTDDTEKRQREYRLKIDIENSEIIAIVELTLKNFII